MYTAYAYTQLKPKRNVGPGGAYIYRYTGMAYDGNLLTVKELTS